MAGEPLGGGLLRQQQAVLHSCCIWQPLRATLVRCSRAYSPPQSICLQVCVFALDSEGAADDDEGEDGTPAYREWVLPAAEFHGGWETLVGAGAAGRGSSRADCKGDALRTAIAGLARQPAQVDSMQRTAAVPARLRLQLGAPQRLTTHRSTCNTAEPSPALASHLLHSAMTLFNHCSITRARSSSGCCATPPRRCCLPSHASTRSSSPGTGVGS